MQPATYCQTAGDETENQILPRVVHEQSVKIQRLGNLFPMGALSGYNPADGDNLPVYSFNSVIGILKGLSVKWAIWVRVPQLEQSLPFRKADIS